MNRLSLLALPAAALATALTVAAAAPAQTPVRIAYGDLNLATAGGRATFDARVRDAARRMCDSTEISQLSLMVACRDDIRTEAHQALAQARATATVQTASR